MFHDLITLVLIVLTYITIYKDQKIEKDICTCSMALFLVCLIPESLKCQSLFQAE